MTTHYGFINSSIPRFYERMPDFFSGHGMLITCLDSNPCPVELGGWQKNLAASGIKHAPIGKSVWIASEDVRAVFRQGKTFFGFDEIYLMRSLPENSLPKLPGRIFTPDGVQFANSVPKQLVETMLALSSDRYLSDGTGIGLNFVCESSQTRDAALAIDSERE